MEIYIEVLVLFNIYIDFLILLMTKIIQRNVLSIKKLILASSVGGIGTLLLFLKIPIFLFLILEFLLSILIILLAFGSKKIGGNLLYFYLNAIILGGLILMINNLAELTTKENFLILFLITPLLLLVYKKQIKKLKLNYNLCYQTRFKINDKFINLNSFFDTGNNLIDPYFKRPVILVNESLIKEEIVKCFYIPYNTITESGVIKAISVDEFEILGLKTTNKVVVGLLPNKLKLKGIDCLLNYKILEEINA